MKHTPGPWKINKWGRNDCIDQFETVITDSRGHGLVIFTQKGKSEKVIANARLIASAPELLEVCELAIWELRGGRGIPVDRLHIANYLEEIVKIAKE